MIRFVHVNLLPANWLATKWWTADREWETQLETGRRPDWRSRVEGSKSG